MEEFKIYRNGQYSVIDNIKFKASIQADILIEKVDHFFMNH